MDQTIPDFKSFMQDYVSLLPQAFHIKEEDAKVWYDAAKSLEPERFFWHYDRLHGLGGSDMGEIVAAYRGEYNMFKTPYDIIEEKLMRRTVGNSTKHTRFGIKMEPVTREMFHEDYGCSSRKDLIQQVDNFTTPKIPWMRCNVDDIVGIGPLAADPKMQDVWLLDYKNKAVIPPEPTITERVQVHMYRKAMVESGYQGNVALLIVYMDYVNKEPVPRVVDYDKDLERQIIEAGNETWQHVLNDTKPRFARTTGTPLVLSEAAKEKVAPLEESIARAKVIADAAKQQVDELQEKLVAIIKEEAGPGLLKSLQIPLATLSSMVKQTLIEPELETLLAAQKHPAADLQKDGKNLDEAKVTAFIKEHGGDPFEFKEKVYDLKKVIDFCAENELRPPVKESFSVSLKASKAKNLSQDDLASIKEQGVELVRSIMPEVDLRNKDLAFGPKL